MTGHSTQPDPTNLIAGVTGSRTHVPSGARVHWITHNPFRVQEDA
ncbi:hypothetical protein QFZ36_002020 [Pseudarthrobacter siccitolerans]|uniref:Uncharacterized protein n=1 Tax=Pseudarthrobacter siccitolerans TaxID=861266 RepID=A0ABU0PKG7_9MICC|nr:hypothetical protein [Pseudarthrobacter siccitolerans]